MPPPPPGATVPVTVGAKEPGAGSLVPNLLWFFLSGIWLFFSYLTSGIVMCITIIGIPLGLGNFKLIPLALFPFGKTIVRNGTTVTGQVYVSF